MVGALIHTKMCPESHVFGRRLDHGGGLAGLLGHGPGQWRASEVVMCKGGRSSLTPLLSLLPAHHDVSSFPPPCPSTMRFLTYDA